MQDLEVSGAVRHIYMCH